MKKKKFKSIMMAVFAISLITAAALIQQSFTNRSKVHPNTAALMLNTSETDMESIIVLPPSCPIFTPGNYYIKGKKSGLYLGKAGTANGDVVYLDSKGTNVWTVARVTNAAIPNTYTVRYKGTTGSGTTQKYMDADFFKTNENDCKVQLWERTGPNGNSIPLSGGNPISTNQEWFIEGTGNSCSKHRIRNVKSNQMYLDAANSGTKYSKLKLWERIGDDETQMFVFEPAPAN